jgi:hypothetical protein
VIHIPAFKNSQPNTCSLFGLSETERERRGEKKRRERGFGF